MQLFTGKRFFRGNLHVHTTGSDGALSPAGVKDIYRHAGYDFLAFSDHDLYDCAPELSEPDFLIIPGGEFAINTVRGERTPLNPESSFDMLLTLADTSAPRFESGMRFKDVREPNSFARRLGALCDWARGAGNLVTLAHAANSRQFADTPASLPLFDMLEVYNHSAQQSGGRGCNSAQWDALLRSGRHINAIATDDAHFKGDDGCGGWICVSADSLTVGSIMDAVRAGRYYSSSGPEIFSLSEENGHVELECSPCRVIRLVSWPCAGQVIFNASRAAFDIPSDAVYARLECVDALGRTAWSNPFYGNGHPDGKRIRPALPRLADFSAPGFRGGERAPFSPPEGEILKSPRHSRLTEPEALLSGKKYIEVWNETDERLFGEGDGFHYYDYCLRMGAEVYAAAPGQTWRVGEDFYCAGGMSVDAFYTENGRVYFSCSGARRITFFNARANGDGECFSGYNAPIYRASTAAAPGALIYVRAFGENGSWAQTNAISVK